MKENLLELKKFQSEQKVHGFMNLFHTEERKKEREDWRETTERTGVPDKFRVRVVTCHTNTAQSPHTHKHS